MIFTDDEIKEAIKGGTRFPDPTDAPAWLPQQHG